MCNCIDEVTQTAKKYLEELTAGVAVISGVTMHGVSRPTIDGQEFPGRTANEVSYKIARLKKDGSTGIVIKKTISMVHAYCPYCGEKYVK